MNREMLYAGTWYPKDKKEIEKYTRQLTKAKVKAVFCPHAGWIYSGQVPVRYSLPLSPAKLYILIGPNHHGLGSPVGVWTEGDWETPLGRCRLTRKRPLS